MTELAEIHVAEDQVVEKIGILRILAEEFFQVDAASSRWPTFQLQNLVKLDRGRDVAGMWPGWPG